MNSYKFENGRIVQLSNGRAVDAWPIHAAPDSVIRAALAWNDANGDFDACDRVTLLEIFICNFIAN